MHTGQVFDWILKYDWLQLEWESFEEINKRNPHEIETENKIINKLNKSLVIGKEGETGGA
jgi:hypothetical protein